MHENDTRLIDDIVAQEVCIGGIPMVQELDVAEFIYLKLLWWASLIL